MHALDQILALTEDVEQRVERGEWAEAGALDAERCRLLAQLFADPASAADLAAYRGILEQLLVRNRQTIQRVEAHQAQVGAASARLGRGSSAVRAYGRNGRAGSLALVRVPEGDEP